MKEVELRKNSTKLVEQEKSVDILSVRKNTGQQMRAISAVLAFTGCVVDFPLTPSNCVYFLLPDKTAMLLMSFIYSLVYISAELHSNLVPCEEVTAVRFITLGHTWLSRFSTHQTQQSEKVDLTVYASQRAFPCMLCQCFTCNSRHKIWQKILGTRVFSCHSCTQTNWTYLNFNSKLQ